MENDIHSKRVSYMINVTNQDLESLQFLGDASLVKIIQKVINYLNRKWLKAPRSGVRKCEQTTLVMPIRFNTKDTYVENAIE